MEDFKYASVEIRVAHTKLQDAQKSFNRSIIQAQTECSHPQVLEAPILRYQHLHGVEQAFRVCRCCGFREYGGYGSSTYLDQPWKARDPKKRDTFHAYADKTLLGTEFAKIVTRDEAHKYVIDIKE